MNNKVFSCHQPNFLPWIGYFHKIYNSDYFVLLDEVQYPKNSIANRNKIKSAQGDQIITVPISKKFNNSSFFSYNEAAFAQENWYEKIIKTLEQSYKKSNFYGEYKNILFDIFRIKNFCEMNISFIKFILNEYEIQTKIFLMSEIYGLLGKKNDLLIEIGKYLNADVYLSGNGARTYNDEEKFRLNGIKVIYQEFEHPEYNQLYLPFIPYLSIIDLLFNEGRLGKQFIIRQNI